MQVIFAMPKAVELEKVVELADAVVESSNPHSQFAAMTPLAEHHLEALLNLKVVHD